jgi:hypothetical protein
MTALMRLFPRKESRTSTHATSVPVTAFTATTASELRKVSFRVATAAGFETACQNPSAPSPVERQMTAAIGISTTRPM